jgi:hypothetical protein
MFIIFISLFLMYINISNLLCNFFHIQLSIKKSLEVVHKIQLRAKEPFSILVLLIDLN